VQELRAVVDGSTAGRYRTVGDDPAEDFPGIDVPPGGEGFDEFLGREATVPLAAPVRLPLLELLEGDEGSLAWQERALCAQTDPEAFFPEKGGSTREAKRVCVSCEVRSECLDYALANDERFGIWGGLSERERRRLKKQAV
jgi:WhiB family transcriptional regulator, redox-sensing transcriptional regulator